MMARRFPLVSSLGILALALSCVTLQARHRYVTYERFGAVGDGVHDDLEAIVKAHAAANEWKLPVKAGSGKTYFIGGGAAVAEIRTDVDWGDACFIIDDRDCEMLQQPIFTVVSDSESREIPSVKSLRKGQENLGVKLRHRSLVVVQDSTQRVYIRKGKNQNSGTPKREIILVEPSGAIDPGTALVWDYDRITGLKAPDPSGRGLQDRSQPAGFPISLSRPRHCHPALPRQGGGPDPSHRRGRGQRGSLLGFPVRKLRRRRDHQRLYPDGTQDLPYDRIGRSARPDGQL